MGALEERTIRVLLDEILNPDEIAILMKRRQRMLSCRGKLLDGFVKLEDDFEAEVRRGQRRHGPHNKRDDPWLEQVLAKLEKLREAVRDDKLWYGRMGRMRLLQRAEIEKVVRIMPRTKYRRNLEAHGDISGLDPEEVQRCASLLLLCVFPCLKDFTLSPAGSSNCSPSPPTRGNISPCACWRTSERSAAAPHLPPAALMRETMETKSGSVFFLCVSTPFPWRWSVLLSPMKGVACSRKVRQARAAAEGVEGESREAEGGQCF